MKVLLSVFVLLFSASAHSSAGPHFPSWLTDSVAKQWAVQSLVEFMEEDDFYKIRSFDVKRSYDEVNKTDALEVVLAFDTPNCRNRNIFINAWASVCSNDECVTQRVRTGCVQGSRKAMKRFSNK
ncbi:hypothetical protein [Bdellovibrio bacteriovorus]|nr:hypothetical protein [Bdellovibrio bacteriovorus]